MIEGDRETPEDAVVRVDEASFLATAIAQRLRPREIEVVCARFGIGGSDAMTPRELSFDLGVSVERVRQLVAKAIMRLRRSIGLTVDGVLTSRGWLPVRFRGTCPTSPGSEPRSVAVQRISAATPNRPTASQLRGTLDYTEAPRQISTRKPATEAVAQGTTARRGQKAVP